MRRGFKILLLIFCVMAFVVGAVSAAQEEEYGTVIADEVNMRTEPRTDAGKITTLALGSTVEVLAKEDSWYRIVYENQVGYVRCDFIFVNSMGSRGGNIIQDQAKLRGGPGQETYVVSSLRAGQGVKVKMLIGDWYFVAAGDQAGYVHRSYVSLTTSSSTTAGDVLKIGMQGQEVKNLQTELFNRGFLSQSDITGNFNSQTAKAVKDFQKAAELSSRDGIAGAETIVTLYDSTNKVRKENAEYNQIKGTVVLLDWFKGGNEWLHRGAKYTITDVKTGLSFRARRFGGWYHADSEPITASDTATMKRISGGKWSWNRRAIWVTYGGKTVAASMHTMPHMVNPTPSNGFDGHFCVHLYKSKVHENSKECPRHQSCVMAAYNAGKKGS